MEIEFNMQLPSKMQTGTEALKKVQLVMKMDTAFI